MPYMILMTDKPGTADLRATTRPAHLDYLDAHKEKLLAAGALIEDDGTGASGSLYILDTEDRGAAEAFLKGDPFDQAGLFSQVVIRRWRKTFFNGQKTV